jgi:hypothetical protein
LYNPGQTALATRRGGRLSYYLALPVTVYVSGCWLIKASSRLSSNRRLEVATKVYWITLRVIIERVQRYIGKWNSQLSDNLTESQMDAVNALYVANQQCLAALPVNPIED